MAGKGLPRVTIVMTARERHALTEATIDSLVRNTGLPYRFIYADSQSPAWLGEVLSRRAKEWSLEVVKFDEPLWPNQIRARIAPAIDTEYAIFLDNDVTFNPGWLEKLVACADETGAGIVGPLYLSSDGGSVIRIHMAGGCLRETPSGNKIVLEESHRLGNADLAAAEAGPGLSREKCDFAEYHCVLIRTALMKKTALFDERIICVHEHIDTALSARKSGYEIYIEPSARVTFLERKPYMLSDLSFFRARWAAAAVESSIKAFCEKWNVIDDERSFADIRRYVGEYRALADPLRPGVAQGSAPYNAMQPHELKQTLAGLFDLGNLRGYRQDEWDILREAYRLAMTLMNGMYRPCGRPFINHLAGTASVLIHYNFRVPVVVAGLLHAAYTHCAQYPAGPQSSIDEVCKALGGKGSPLEAHARAHALGTDRWKKSLASPTWQLELSIFDAEILAVEAANEADMHLSGEFRYSGRRDMKLNDMMDLITHVCKTLGVPGLNTTLLIENKKLSLIPFKEETRNQSSFRIVGAELIPAVNDAVCSMLRSQGNLQ